MRGTLDRKDITRGDARTDASIGSEDDRCRADQRRGGHKLRSGLEHWHQRASRRAIGVIDRRVIVVMARRVIVVIRRCARLGRRGDTEVAMDDRSIKRGISRVQVFPRQGTQ